MNDYMRRITEAANKQFVGKKIVSVLYMDEESAVASSSSSMTVLS